MANLMKALGIVGLFFILACGTSYMACDPIVPATIDDLPLALVPVPNQIEENLSATLLMDYDEDGMSTAVVVGKEHIPETPKQFRYYALTAEHCIDEIEDLDFVEATGWVWLDPNAPPVQVLSECEILIRLPNPDIAIIAFESEIVISPITVAPLNKFLLDTHVGDDIYGIGCDSGHMPFVRKGVVGSKNYTGLLRDQSRAASNPSNYFIPSMNIWFGSSGGGAFNDDHEYIGMFVLLDLSRTKIQVTPVDGGPSIVVRANIPMSHMGTVIKSDTIRMWLAMSNALYVLENEDKEK